MDIWIETLVFVAAHSSKLCHLDKPTDDLWIDVIIHLFTASPNSHQKGVLAASNFARNAAQWKSLL